MFLNDAFSSRHEDCKIWIQEDGWLYVTFGVQDLLRISSEYGRWHDSMGCFVAMVDFDILGETAVRSPEIRTGDDDLLIVGGGNEPERHAIAAFSGHTDLDTDSPRLTNPEIKTKDDRISLDDLKSLEIVKKGCRHVARNIRDVL